MNAKGDPKTKVEELKEALAKRREMGVRKKDAGKRQEVKGKEGEGSEGFDELAKQLSAAEEDAKAHYDKLLRVMAELDNFKKRSDREKQEMVRYSNEQLVKDLLPVLDGLDRVLEHLPQGASKELVDFVSGVQLVAKQLINILDKYGLKEIPSEGERFNPEVHEAVAHLPSNEVEADHIIEVHRKGYILNDRVVRAAMVTVSKGEACLQGD